MIVIPTDARADLAAAQFILKEGYIDWTWRQRVAEYPPSATHSIGKWPFVRQADNVVALKRKVKS